MTTTLFYFTVRDPSTSYHQVPFLAMNGIEAKHNLKMSFASLPDEQKVVLSDKELIVIGTFDMATGVVESVPHEVICTLGDLCGGD